ERRLYALEPRELLLQLRVEPRRPGNSPDGGRTDPEALDRVARRLAQLGMVGESEVVVGAEVQDLATVDRDPCPLRRFDRAQPDQETFAFEALAFVLYELQLVFGHVAHIHSQPTIGALLTMFRHRADVEV